MSDQPEVPGCVRGGCGCIFGFVAVFVILLLAGAFLGWVS